MTSKFQVTEWVTTTLENFGCSTAKIRIRPNELLAIPVQGQEKKVSEFWTGLYHLMDFEGEICLYVCDALRSTGKFYKSEFSAELLETFAIHNVDEVSVEEIIIKSKKEALSDEKFINEQLRVQAFIEKGKIKKLSTVSQLGVSVDQQKEVNNKQIETASLKIEKFNDLEDLYESLPIATRDSCVGLQKYFSPEIRGFKELRTVDRPVSVNNLEGLKFELEKGQYIASYKDSNYSNLPTFALITQNQLGGFNEQSISNKNAVNFKVFNELSKDSEKWIFIAADFFSALEINKSTGFKAIAVTNLNGIEVILDEIIRGNPDTNIVICRNENITHRMKYRELIMQDLKYSVFHAFLEQENSNWGGYSLTVQQDIFKQSLREAIKKARAVHS
ncbi:hypothetical protein AMD27_16575 (plasmid) [Acinetobacter sp. TGL-Y2]|uniref:hypothetical protein n=1 Tax=Acinetobacter sp. TGL-Y2 TaxID=1407071 RepID=UPI0007A64715|nr:hypothetical protein [Acinetobacter sp. TGL-Y2]AMW80531.1 hypothetical protein AMD27_16575 [Acinetobacter sp. TGL-Y2]